MYPQARLHMAAVCKTVAYTSQQVLVLRPVRPFHGWGMGCAPEWLICARYVTLAPDSP
jgi:hypothetical protein